MIRSFITYRGDNSITCTCDYVRYHHQDDRWKKRVGPRMINHIIKIIIETTLSKIYSVKSSHPGLQEATYY